MGPRLDGYLWLIQRVVVDCLAPPRNLRTAPDFLSPSSIILEMIISNLGQGVWTLWFVFIAPKLRPGGQPA